MNRATVVWRTAMSIDGRIASPSDSLDFLETVSAEAQAIDDFPAFLRTIDGIIVGAGTLRWLIRGGHGWPHGDTPTWLVSHDTALAEQVGATEAPFRRVDGDLAELMNAIDAAGHRRVWLSGGGDIAGQLLALDRIDEIETTIAPVVLGAGRPLFGELELPSRRFRPVDARPLAGNSVSVKWVRAAV